jgi:serpin B
MLQRTSTIASLTGPLLAVLVGLPGAACTKRDAGTSTTPAEAEPSPPPPEDAAALPAEPDGASTARDAGAPTSPANGSAGMAPEVEPTAVPDASGTGVAADLPPPAEAAPLTAREARVVAGAVNGLAGDLHPRLAQGETNMAFSPASIALALAMTSGGARGRTADEMNAVLHLGDDPDGARSLLGREQRLLVARTSETVRLAIANRLFGERTYVFVRAFLEWTAEQYAAPLETVDFVGAFEAARGRVNGWVAEQTLDRIPEILPAGSVSADTRLVLANAIYFKGKWSLEFQESATRPRTFTRADGTTAEVPMMEAEAEFAYAERDGTQLLELPYDGGELSMIVVLPSPGQAPDPWLTSGNLERLDALSRRKVEVRLPRFRIDPPAPRKLNDDLVALGMVRAFQADAAEFEGLADPPDAGDRLFVSAVFHRAFVEVNEEGTEAAAATAVVMALRGRVLEEPERPRFHADRPFLFLIRENRTGLILFVGRVGDPGGRTS